MLENEENEANRLVRGERGRPALLHRAMERRRPSCAARRRERRAHRLLRRLHGDTEKLGRALAEGFAFQGEIMPYRGRARGEPSRPAARRFVAFIQNHDQIGNRAFGERLTAIAPARGDARRAAMYLLLPQMPMLFMGEEWGAAQPFPSSAISTANSPTPCAKAAARNSRAFRSSSPSSASAFPIRWPRIAAAIGEASIVTALIASTLPRSPAPAIVPRQ